VINARAFLNYLGGTCPGSPKVYAYNNDILNIRAFLLPAQSNNSFGVDKLKRLAMHIEVTVQLHMKFCNYEVG